MEKRCFACMNLIEETVCRHCGHNNADPQDQREDLIKPGTLVGDRYYIGLPVDRNGEGVTYIAFDESVQTRVRLREFFPRTLCHRESDHKTVTVNSGYEIQYKALMTDFVELSKQLIGISASNNLLKAIHILSDNGTIYVVYEDVNGVPLTKYLAQNAGEISWEETENLFLPLLYTVKLLNSNGIIHRGISPDTIIVTGDPDSRNHELKLKGVCTSAVRAINTEIKAELFPGYAAPEQYEKCASHGEWTDVYAICAVLYKVLTGSAPTRADIRLTDGERMPSPSQLNSSVPRNVSAAIMRGLECDRSRRTLYIKDLIGGLYAAVPDTQEPQRIMDEEDIEEEPEFRRKRKFRLPVWLIVVLITLPLMLGIFFFTYYYVLGDHGTRQESSAPVSSELSSLPSSEAQPSSEAPSKEEVAQIVMDNFVGEVYEDLVQNETFSKLYVFKPKKEVYDESVPIGQVIEQDIEAGTVVNQGVEVLLTVSKGPQYVTLPPFTDPNGQAITAEDYSAYLTERGLKVKVEKMDDPATPKDQIAKLNHDISELIDRDKVSEIIIYVSTGESYSAAQPSE